MTPETRTKPQVAIMNAVHDLPVLVARDKGLFKGLLKPVPTFNVGRLKATAPESS